MSPLDLHVLGTPPAFVLSQDQTLMFNSCLRSWFYSGSLHSSYWLSFLRFFPLYRFQGSALSSELVHNSTLSLFRQHLFSTFFEKFFNFLYSRTFVAQRFYSVCIIVRTLYFIYYYNVRMMDFSYYLPQLIRASPHFFLLLSVSGVPSVSPL